MTSPNPNRHTFDTTDEVEEKWKVYKEKRGGTSFTWMANKAIIEYLTRELGKK